MIKTLFLISLAFLISCSEEENCEEREFWEDCRIEEPFTGKLNFLVTINADNPEVLIKIYTGDEYETGDLVVSDYVYEAEFSYDLPIGNYAVTALYYVGSDSVLAVDADGISKERVEYCDEDCWEITEGQLDLTL